MTTRHTAQERHLRGGASRSACRTHGFPSRALTGTHSPGAQASGDLFFGEAVGVLFVMAVLLAAAVLA